MEHRGAGPDEADAWPASCSSGSATASLRGACSITGRGSGIPANRSRAGRFGCYWRRDGVSVWEDPSLFADESRDYGYGDEDAGRSSGRWPTGSASTRRTATPGYEDVWYYLWKERRLPVNVDVLKNNLDDPEERRRLAKVFEQGLDQVVGYALPLRRSRRTTGDPLGQRPLVPPPRAHVPDSGRLADGLPPAAGLAPLGDPRGHRRPFHERDPFAHREPLPPAAGAGARAAGRRRRVGWREAGAADREHRPTTGPPWPSVSRLPS